MHLEESREAVIYRQTWYAFLIPTSPNREYSRGSGVRNNSVFANRLRERVAIRI